MIAIESLLDRLDGVTLMHKGIKVRFMFENKRTLAIDICDSPLDCMECIDTHNGCKSDLIMLERS